MQTQTGNNPSARGRLAQLVQSICLTSRGSAVRIRQRPPLKMKHLRHCRECFFRYMPRRKMVTCEFLASHFFLAWEVGLVGPVGQVGHVGRIGASGLFRTRWTCRASRTNFGVVKRYESGGCAVKCNPRYR